MNVQWNLARKQFLTLSYTHIQGNIEGNNESEQSRFALENLRNQLQFGFNLFIVDQLYLTSQINYLDRVNLEDYTLVDLKLSYNGSKVKPFLIIDNILDQEYRETNLVMMPGRWIKLGATFKFN